MSIVRGLITAAALLALVGVPVLSPGLGTYSDSVTVSAAPRAYPAGDNHNENGNWNENRNDNGNSNRNDNDDNDNRHWTRPHHPPPPPPPPPPQPAGIATHCYAAGEAGPISLTLPGGTVTLTVVPVSTFPSGSRVTLAKIDPATLPATPGARLDDIAFELRAQDGCAGDALGELPAAVNLGLSYSVPATGASLTFAIWDGSSWSTVPTVPDPSAGNPYISATVHRAGTYTVYQAR